MATIIIDGKQYSKEDAKVSVYDHGFLYGDGIFEGLRVYNSKIFKLDEHIARLYDSAKALMLKIELDSYELKDLLLETLKKDGRTDGYIRVVVTRGKGALGINPNSCPKTSTIIIIDDIQLFPEEYYIKGIDIITAATRRLAHNCWDPRVKSLNYLNNIMAKMDALQAGCLEAVVLNEDGIVTEGSADNIFIVKDGILKTPAAHLGLLRGITRDTILEIARDMKIKTEEGSYTRYDLYTADELFLTGSGAEVIPVISMDKRIIGDGIPGEVFKKLLKSYRDLVNR